MSSLRNSITLALLLSSALGWAQPDVNLEDLRSRYGKHQAVLLNYVMHYTIGADAKGIKATMETNEQICHLNVKGSSTMPDRVGYDPHFYVVEDLEAMTWVPGEKGYVKKAVTDFQDVQSVDGEAFLDSRRYKEYRFPLVQSGSITESRYTIKFLEAGSLGSFGFASPVPMVYGELVVTVSDDVELGFRQFGRTDNIEHTVTKKGSNTIYTWKVRDVEPFKQFDYQMTDDLDRPHLFIYVKSYKQKGKVIRHLDTVDDLYRYNYNFIRDLSSDPSGLLSTVVDSIVRTHEGETEVVRGIFQWVQDNIRYIAFEEGMGGFVPRPANFVCEKKYGDCKDMANLIKTMLGHAGIPAYLCWVGTRSIGYTYEQLPLPNADNHMIAAYKKDGEYIFLDATSKEHPFGFPSWGIQGKQTLISIDENTYDAPFIPVVPADQNKVYEEVVVELNGKDLTLSGNATLTGYARSMVTERINATSKQREKEAWKSILERASNKCSLESYESTNFSDRDQPLIIRYSMKITDYARSVSNELYVNMNLHTALTEMKPDTTDRYCGVDFLHTMWDESTYKLVIPEGYSVKKLPESLLIERDDYLFDFSYRIEENQVIVYKKFVLNKINIKSADVQQWVADLTAIDKAFQQVVVLIKP